MAEEKGKQAAGENKGRNPWTLREFGGQPVWDWLHLLSALAIPVVLAIGGFWFTAQQDTRQQQIEDKRARQAQKIEDQRAAVERELAERRADDEALQAYLDQMSGLLLERDLRASDNDSEVRTLARARTLTVLSRLDPSGKKALMQFLVEADLVERVDGRDPLISLHGADLRYANLRATDLSSTDLSSTDLSYADLSYADLSYADLSRADLDGADLRATDLDGADLSSAYLGGADLSFSDGITNEELEEQAASLTGTTMPNAQKYEDWLKDR